MIIRWPGQVQGLHTNKTGQIKSFGEARNVPTVFGKVWNQASLASPLFALAALTASVAAH